MEGKNLVNCSGCGNSIKKTSLNIHKNFCRGVENKPRFNSLKTSLKKNIEKMNKIRSTPTSKKKTPRVADMVRKNQADDIVCPKCSQNIDIDDIEGHIDSCEYKVCDFCSSAYPSEFLSEHRRYCRIANQPNGEQYEYSDSGNDNLISEEELEEAYDESDNDNEEEYHNHNGFYTHNYFSNNFNWTNQQTTPSNMFFSSFNNTGSYPDVTIERIHRDSSGNITRTVTRMGNTTIHPHMMGDVNLHRNFMNLNPELFTDEAIERLMEELCGQNRGLDRSEINRIPKIRYKAPTMQIENEKDKCPICITELENNTEIRKMPCDHIFHPSCIDTWLASNSQCPICKLDLQEHFRNK